MLRKILARCGLIIIGIAFALSIAELIARALPSGWGDDRPRFCEYHHERGWANKASINGHFSSSDFVTEIRHNARGERGPEHPYARKAGMRRVLILGDSFAWGFGVSESERFGEIAAALQPHVEIVNGGCSGYGTDQELLYYRREGMKYQPDDVVLMLHLHSDLKNNVSSYQYGYHKPLVKERDGALEFSNTPVPASSFGFRFERSLSRISALWRLISNRRIAGEEFGKLASTLIDNALGSREPAQLKSEQPAATLTCLLLRDLDRDVRSRGSRLLVVHIPDLIKGSNEFVDDPRYQQVEECLEESHIAQLNLAPLFKAELARRPTPHLVFDNDLHWNSHGHKVAGKLIAARLFSDP